MTTTLTITTIINFICNLVFAIIDVLLINYYFDAKYKRKFEKQYLILIPCAIVLGIVNTLFSILRIENILITILIILLIINLYESDSKIKLKLLFQYT